MTDITFDGLLVVSAIALAAPLLTATVPGLRRIPAVVVEILAGIVVVPVLKDSGQADTDLGRLTIAGATVADFSAIVLLSLFFSTGGHSGAGGTLILLGLLAVLAVAVAAFLSRLGRSMGLEALLVRL